MPGPVCGLNTTGWADPSPWLVPSLSTKPRWEGKGRFHFSSRTFSALSNSSRGGPALQTHCLCIQLPRPPNDHSLLDGVRAHTGVPPPPTQATQGTPSASPMVSGNVLFLLGKTALILKPTYSHIWQALHPYHSPGRRERSGDSTPILQTRELSTLRVCVRADVKPEAHPWDFTNQGVLPATNRAWAQGPGRGPKVQGQSRGRGRGRSLPTMPPPPAPAPTKDRVRSKPPATAQGSPVTLPVPAPPSPPPTMNAVRVKGQRWVRSRGPVPPPPLAGEPPAFPRGDVHTLPPQGARAGRGSVATLACCPCPPPSLPPPTPGAEGTWGCGNSQACEAEGAGARSWPTCWMALGRSEALNLTC